MNIANEAETADCAGCPDMLHALSVGAYSFSTGHSVLDSLKCGDYHRVSEDAAP